MGMGMKLRVRIRAGIPALHTHTVSLKFAISFACCVYYIIFHRINVPVHKWKSMTSRNPERSRSWPQYVWCPLSRKRLEIATWWQCRAYRKWPPGNRMVTWPMTSRDPQRSRSWPQYVSCLLSRKWLEKATWWQWSAWYAHAQWRFSIVSMRTWCLGQNISETVRDRDLDPKDMTPICLVPIISKMAWDL